MLKSFEFLKNVSLVAVEKTTSVKASRTAVERNPVNADLRLFKNGAIYPSLALIEEFDLQFRNKAAVDAGDVGMAADIFSSVNWPNYPQGTDHAIFIAFLSKSAPKVSIFGSSKFDEEGNPSDVATQGATTFGLSLIEMLEEVYGFTFAEDQKFVDLVILRDVTLAGPNGKTIVPKVVSRGAKKGELSYEIRENVVCMPLLINLEEENADAADSPSDLTSEDNAQDNAQDEELLTAPRPEAEEAEEEVAAVEQEEEKEEEQEVEQEAAVPAKRVPFKRVARS